MRSRFSCWLLVFGLSVWSPAWGQGTSLQSAPKNGSGFSDKRQSLTKVPSGVILVKGAWSSSSDSVTPLPEDGEVDKNVFRDPYFAMTYVLPPDWGEKYQGPPPSESGRYVLAQLSPQGPIQGPARGTILITAQDMFFTPLPATNAFELIHYSKDHLQADYRVETVPRETRVAGHFFTFFAYWSPVAQLHWYVLATEIRCHVVEIVLTSRDTQLLDSLIQGMSQMKLLAEGNPTAGAAGRAAVPVCIKDYARPENVISRVDPMLTEHRFNPIPVRIIIDKEGRVKHIHFLSAFPDQAKLISDALRQWRFKPYRRKGQPMEVETGILFGRAPPTVAPQTIE
jgi:hypothetical protein